MKQGKHSKVEGPFKSFVNGVAIFGGVISIGGFVSGNTGGAIVVLSVSVFIGWLGSRIPNINQAQWKD